MTPSKPTYPRLLFAIVMLLSVASCSTQKNTAQSRWWHAFNTRYNVYYNGEVSYIEGSLAKEEGNTDNYLEIIPLYTVGNKWTRNLGKAQFDRTIEKCQKAIQLHSIKQRPEWKPGKRKTAADIEWLNRKEYNPFLWKVWLLMGKAQFHQGLFDEAAATFAYMSRLYQTQPAIYGKARAWLAKAYTEGGWLYDAEDVIRNMQRDSIDWRAAKEWSYAYATYYLKTGNYAQAIPYLQKVIKVEMRKKQKAREWFLLGQLYQQTGQTAAAWNAYKHVLRLQPPYELALNARIAQSEVAANKQGMRMLGRLKRMTKSDNNQQYLDRLYFAIGNIYLAQKDTTQAIAAYETGNSRSTRNGIEKGLLLLKLGNLYWQQFKLIDARRCYGEAIGLLDRDRADYEQLSQRSKLLDELVPHLETVELQDSLQRLARMDEAQRNRIIDKIIAQQKANDKQLAQQQSGTQNAVGGTTPANTNRNAQPAIINTGNTTQNWYFYNPLAVQQGKATFERIWGKRKNEDNWQRANKTVVAGNTTATTGEQADSVSTANATTNAQQTPSNANNTTPSTYTRAYYLAQIPLTAEQLKASNEELANGLFNAGVLLKDKFEWLKPAEKMLLRLVQQHPEFSQKDELFYHLFLLYSRLAQPQTALHYKQLLAQNYPNSAHTQLITSPHFEEDARRGQQIEDSLYTQTYEYYKQNQLLSVIQNSQKAIQRFPNGANLDKFLFIEAMALLQQQQTQEGLNKLNQLVNNKPESQLAQWAGMIINGLHAGKRVRNANFDMERMWQYRALATQPNDSTRQPMFSAEKLTNFKFVIAYAPDAINQNQLLYALARFNFTHFLVRNFDIEIVQTEGPTRMEVSGFRNIDEAQLYALELSRQPNITQWLNQARVLIISDQNLQQIGTNFSYDDYDKFYKEQLSPTRKLDPSLLQEPVQVVTQPQSNEASTTDGNAGKQPVNNTNSIIINAEPNKQQGKPTQPNNQTPVVVDKPQPKKQKTFDVEDEYYDVEGF